MPEILNTYRRTGRTTKMLLKAIEIATSGTFVYVVGASQRHALDLRDSARRLSERRLEDLPMIFISIKHPGLIFNEKRLRGAPHDSVVMIDHYATESYLLSP